LHRWGDRVELDRAVNRGLKWLLAFIVC